MRPRSGRGTSQGPRGCAVPWPGRATPRSSDLVAAAGVTDRALEAVRKLDLALPSTETLAVVVLGIVGHRAESEALLVAGVVGEVPQIDLGVDQDLPTVLPVRGSPSAPSSRRARGHPPSRCRAKTAGRGRGERTSRDAETRVRAASSRTARLISVLLLESAPKGRSIGGFRKRSARGAVLRAGPAARQVSDPAVRAPEDSRHPRQNRTASSLEPAPSGAYLWRTMRAELLQLAADLAQREEPFVLAVVVRRQPASSSQAGGHGADHGLRRLPWLARGAAARSRPWCARRSGRLPRASRASSPLAPDPETERRPGVTVFPMTCNSGGTVEIYLEPVLPAPAPRGVRRFAHRPRPGPARQGHGLLGRRHRSRGRAGAVPRGPIRCSPIPAGLRSSLRRPTDPRFAVGWRRSGERDESAIRDALALAPDYVGVVASRRRFAQMREVLLSTGGDRRGDRIRSTARRGSTSRPRGRRRSPSPSWRRSSRSSARPPSARTEDETKTAGGRDGDRSHLRHDGRHRRRPPHRRA